MRLRFTLASGRKVSLESFHLTWTHYVSSNETISLEDKIRSLGERIFPGIKLVVVGLDGSKLPAANTCFAIFQSSPVRENDALGSNLALCWFVENPDLPIRNIVIKGLSMVDWERDAQEWYWS